MSNLMQAQALIAEDEPVLARGLARTLGKLWPRLHICSIVHDGNAAVEATLLHSPDVVFMDIQMPERNGLDAAQAIVDDWPVDKALPLIVFVTAFDRFAVDAFERAAIDYVLKPVQIERLSLTCERLVKRLQERQPLADDVALAPLKALQGTSTRTEAPLSLIQAGIGSTLHMVPTAEVIYFEADDKYVRVVTAERELLIRTPLRELAPRLDSSQFVQIHRSAVVRTALIDRVVREETGKIVLHLKGRAERLNVSRSYAHLFKAM
jgi:DNA-binding LytR/AlgR family response regulator